MDTNNNLLVEPYADVKVKFLSKLPPQDFSDYNGLRDGLRAMTEAVIDLIGPAPPGTKEFFHDIPMRDGYMSSLKIHKPSEDVAGPLIVLCFGGGFIAGDNNQMTPMARAFVRENQLFEEAPSSLN